MANIWFPFSLLIATRSYSWLFDTQDQTQCNGSTTVRPMLWQVHQSSLSVSGFTFSVKCADKGPQSTSWPKGAHKILRARLSSKTASRATSPCVMWWEWDEEFRLAWASAPRSAPQKRWPGILDIIFCYSSNRLGLRGKTKSRQDNLCCIKESYIMQHNNSTRSLRHKTEIKNLAVLKTRLPFSSSLSAKSVYTN